ncbi:MAG: alpha-glucan family phosphorylase, partial [Bacteroidales bacterium]|nr:alpha-glucan family phosphorylase [Bacteroidales bacterium]
MGREESITPPELIFEVSWEVCNKVGGIHTVLASKAPEVVKAMGDQYLVIGPDIWREVSIHPEFDEDPTLFRGWKSKAESEGLHLRIGRWNVEGNPVAIMVDFTPLFPQKDVIFSKAWENFHLDSISGQWDYIEAAMFGYAAGQVIKSFTDYYRHSPAMAHFHEWMTGMGVLFLKQEAPHITTAFTTHATVTGRAIAGNAIPLYDQLTGLNGDEMAGRLGVKSKHSLEKMAANEAHCFATVSEITARECTQFLMKTPDVITPNGFDPLLIPKIDEIEGNQQTARSKLIRLAESVTGEKYAQNVFLLGTSGRYEFKNKGLDVFIQSLGALNRSSEVNKRMLAFILVPANHYGPRKSIAARMAGNNQEITGSPYLSHNLHDENDDPIIHLLKSENLFNGSNDSVHVIFVPSYLNGSDGLLNMTYYQLLVGLELTIFPSYYEPWGYTPLESLAFSVPTVTTTYAGFGLWVKQKFSNENLEAISIIDRENKTDAEIIQEINQFIVALADKKKEALDQIRDQAKSIASTAQWKDFYSAYKKLYDIGFDHAGVIPPPNWDTVVEADTSERISHYKMNEPIWKSVVVDSVLPDKLKGLNDIAKNLWWTWNYDAEQLFKMISEDLWATFEHNPIKLLMRVPYDRLLSLEEDTEFMELFHRVQHDLKEYLAVAPDTSKPVISYFSMEYGLHSSLKIYSGGLGILAGDYLKEASDQNYPLVAVGLLYRHGYFRQRLTITGDQLSENVREEFSELPVSPLLLANGDWLKIEIAFPGRTVKARVWEVLIGRIKLMLLDTDFEDNQMHDRNLTSNLYGGDEEHRLKQEMLLGVGGVRVLAALDLKPDVYHCNEGHAAFIGFERMNRLMNFKQFTFNESIEIVRGSTLFTTHTPVPAGHDSFHEDLIRTYMGHYPDRLKIGWDEFIDLGRMNPGDKKEKFSMSYLAANLSQEINAVSRLHGDVTKKMFAPLWKGYYPEELHIGYVTNGVHYSTWTSRKWQKLHQSVFGDHFLDNLSDESTWSKIYEVDDQMIWTIRNEERERLINYLKRRLHKNSIRRHESPRLIVDVVNKLSPDILTIGFARRFATYKRAHLLFKDLDRLNAIVNHPEHPVQFLFAGKAHPRDNAGQDLIRYIVEISRRPEFIGRIVFLEDYDMTVARHLVQGVDIWLNTPTRPLEASGTSGMKAAMNGGMNFSVLDGWWCEGYREGAGWAISEDRVYDDQ